MKDKLNKDVDLSGILHKHNNDITGQKRKMSTIVEGSQMVDTLFRSSSLNPPISTVEDVKVSSTKGNIINLTVAFKPNIG